MSEMEQEKIVSLNADKAIRRALDIQEAKDLLKREGFCVDNLWHIDDIQQNYHCEDDEAMEVLEIVCANDYIVSQTFDAIDMYIECNTEQGEFKPKTNSRHGE
jgi:hypothetical protein